VAHAVLRLYAELNDFLAPAARQRAVTRACAPRSSIHGLGLLDVVLQDLAARGVRCEVRFD
jgi:Mut7-C ubiquitin